jgi:hypothetical protein
MARLFVVAGFVLATTAVTPASAAAGTPGYCPDGNGVTVIIDFQELGGTTLIRCAPGDQPTGHAALKNAGIQITGTQRWGESFVCRVEGKPTAATEACIDTPPATAYWSYWYAPNGGAWKYSEWGVMNRKPPLGSFEGWSFSKNKSASTNPSPRIGPVRPTAPPPQPPAGDPGGSTGGGAGAGTVVPKPPTSAAPTTTPTPLPSTPPSSQTTPPSSTSPTAPTSGTANGVAWSGGAEKPTANAGFPVGTAIAGGIILLIAAAGGATWWRRSRADR